MSDDEPNAASEKPMIRAMGVTLMEDATSSAMRTKAAAPSANLEEFAAVIVPLSLSNIVGNDRIAFSSIFRNSVMIREAVVDEWRLKTKRLKWRRSGLTWMCKEADVNEWKWSRLTWLIRGYVWWRLHIHQRQPPPPPP